MEKINARKLSTESQQQLRHRVIRLRKAGRIYKEIAEITGIPEASVCKLYRAYLQDGRSAVTIKKRGRPAGSCCALTKEQKKELKKAIRDKCPDQMKLAFALWTRTAVQQPIKQRWAIEMPICTVGECLNRWGFTPQKPLKKACKQNPKAVKAWLDTEYPGIAKRAKKENAEIHWNNETGSCNDSYHGKIYA